VAEALKDPKFFSLVERGRATCLFFLSDQRANRSEMMTGRYFINTGHAIYVVISRTLLSGTRILSVFHKYTMVL
jgi:hypothetical protein